MKYKVTLAFDGRNFCGFQFQPGVRTVQGTLTGAMRALLGDCSVTGCSRTDSGVHAKGFVILVDAPDGSVPCDRLCIAANRRLPDDIVFIKAEPAGENFHPRYSAVSKEYEYLVNISEKRNPFRHGLVYDYLRKLDTDKMNYAAELCVGIHDFSAFMATGSTVRNTVRTVYSCGVTGDGKTVKINVCGSGFLYNMVRIITGTLIYVSEGKIPPQGITDIIASKKRSEAGPTVPPCGLYLNKVNY